MISLVDAKDRDRRREHRELTARAQKFLDNFSEDDVDATSTFTARDCDE